MNPQIAIHQLPSPVLAVDFLDDVVTHNISPSPIFTLFGEPVYFTNDMLMMLLTAGLMLYLFLNMARELKTNPVPTGFRNFLEAAMVFLRQELFVPMLGKWADVFTPYLWTAFFFILFLNLLGMLPVNQLIELTNYFTGWKIPEFWGGATGNVSFTAVMALSTFFIVHVSGIGAHIRAVRTRQENNLAGHEEAGVGHDDAVATTAPAAKPNRVWPIAVVGGILLYLKNMVPTVHWTLWPMMFGLELLGTLVKPLSLCMRLFAVMMSGPLVVAVFVSMIFMAASYLTQSIIGLPVICFGVAFEALHLLEAFLQAFIFTLLSAAYIAAAVAPDH
ncbi:MAG TPA: F0F1 ATP synthase subunit A [Phycisphaerae bacterium]|nr:F0F1 ATP synthase subunit A [Phycisphaerae bacterium]